MRALFLINSFSNLDENPAYLGEALHERGWTVNCGILHTLAVRADRIHARVAPLPDPVRMHDSMPGPSRFEPVDDHDLVWVLNRPHPGMAWDIWQLLWLLQTRCEFVNRVEGLCLLNNKHAVSFLCPPEHRLEAYSSNEFETLWSLYRSEPRRSWVVKPTNAASGTDVYRLDPDDTNARAILQSMTGNTATTNVLLDDPGLIGLQNRYAVLQSYAPEVLAGEKRLLIAGGKTIYCFGRKSAPEDHRANVAQGGDYYTMEPTPDELELGWRLGRALLEHGIRYAGLDIVWPYVIEFNLMNPGGLHFAVLLEGQSRAAAAVDRVLELCRPGRGARRTESRGGGRPSNRSSPVKPL